MALPKLALLAVLLAVALTASTCAAVPINLPRIAIPPTSDTGCWDGSFPCANGTGCVYPSQLCDGYDDCLDGSDETADACPVTFNCSATDRISCELPSAPQQCIYLDEMCNDYPSCPPVDGVAYDENPAVCANFNCSAEYEDFCPSGTGCIWSGYLCDGTTNCADGSDETPSFCSSYNCSATDRMECPSGVGCIFGPWSLCDGTKDCSDGSDENPAFCKNYTCPADELKCSDGLQCIYETQLCDGNYDCTDKSDESTTLCSTYNCTADGRIFCPSGLGCLDSQCEICDGSVPPHCLDGSDQLQSNCHLKNETACIFKPFPCGAEGGICFGGNSGGPKIKGSGGGTGSKKHHPKKKGHKHHKPGKHHEPHGGKH